MSVALALDRAVALGLTVEPGRDVTWVREPRADARRELARAVAAGLGSKPRRVPCSYLYDPVGSELFERICETPEYYLTRCEADLLARHGAALARAVGRATLIELGPGSTHKTSLLVRAFERPTWIGIDVSATALAATAEELARTEPGVPVAALATSYERGLDLVAGLSPALLAFLGSSIGNFAPPEYAAFMQRIAGTLRPGDHFLLGVDLVKDKRTLERAYDDAAGFSARFNLNYWARLNRELGTEIPLEHLEYKSHYDERGQQIEMYTRFLRDIAIEVDGRRIQLARGEQVLVEISRKFHVPEVIESLAQHGLAQVATYTDDAFALILSRKI